MPSPSHPPVVDPVLPRQHLSWAHRLDREVARQRHRTGEVIDRCRCAGRCAAPAPPARGAIARSACSAAGMPAPLSPAASLRHFASTAASSIAMPAPCAANGSMAWAASPSSAIAPLVHSSPSGSVNSANFLQASTAPIIIRAGPGQRRRGEHVLQFVAVGGRAPARPVPGSRHHRDHVDLPRARDRIGDEMRVRPHPELHPPRGIFARQLGRLERSAPGDQPGEARLHLGKQMLPHRRPDAVGADQRQRQILLPRSCRRALTTVRPLACARDVLELAAEPQLDVGMLA